jgi:hypothetical protein
MKRSGPVDVFGADVGTLVDEFQGGVMVFRFGRCNESARGGRVCGADGEEADEGRRE